MIGEIRDSPTAEIAIRAALTGHLVLATVHTNDAAAVIPRLINMGIEPYLLASVFRAAAAQRLLRKICPQCKETYLPDAEERLLLDKAGIKQQYLYRGAGCRACDKSGYSGRTVAAEIFHHDSGLEELIAGGAHSAALNAYLQACGVKRLLHTGLEKAAAGVTTVAEVLREIEIEGIL
jgi:type II secretory ATPase GspE/PulE/Tfp pilus assembly ATPase PilB-like protein